MIPSKQIDVLNQGFKEALNFCQDYNFDEEQLDDYPEYSQALKDDIELLVTKFYNANQDYLTDIIEELLAIGRDLYYTLRGHGVGFWENDRGYDHGSIFDQWCKEYGYITSPYLGDDGLIYLEL